MNPVSTVGLDLAKHIFQLHGADSAGAVVFRQKLRRGQLLAFLAADSEDVARQFRDEDAQHSDMMSPVFSGLAGVVLSSLFWRPGQAAADCCLGLRIDSPVRSRRWALWMSRSSMASA